MPRRVSPSARASLVAAALRPADRAVRLARVERHSGGIGTSAQGKYASGVAHGRETSSGYNVNKTRRRRRAAPRRNVNKDINTEEGSASRSSTATNAWGQSASRDRTAQNEGGYASIQGNASTSTGREASGDFVAGRTATGQPAYAGTVNTKYNGNYATAGAQESLRRLDDGHGRTRTAGRSRPRCPRAIAPARTTAARTTPTAGRTTGPTRTAASTTTTRCRRPTTRTTRRRPSGR